MHPRRRHQFAAKAITVSWILAICVCAVVTCRAQTSPRVVIRDDVPLKHRTELLLRLRAISGWSDLRFDNRGALRWTTEDFTGGSKSARALLTQAAGGNDLIVLEDASSRSDVAFCRVVPGRLLAQEQRSVRAFVVLIDFNDFRQISGDQQARAAFDVGWAVLHEVHHVVNDSEDAQSITEVGACERDINTMRFELGLPIRATYYFSPLPAKVNPEFQSRLVRLAFEKHDAAANRTRRYWLVWDAMSVGGLVQGQTAVLR